MTIDTKVSIILPVYNSEQTIANTIESVLNQTYKNIELIIVNDGSKDNSETICLSYAKSDNRIIFESISNNGVGHARNLAISKARGEYICFIDSDDIYEPDYIEIMLKNAKENEMVISGYYAVIDGESHIVSSDGFVTSDICDCIEKLQSKLMFNQLWNKLYKRNILVENNIKFNEKISLCEDLMFNIEYIKYCRSISVIENPLYEYFIGTSGLGFRYKKNNSYLKLESIDKLEELYDINKKNKEYIYHSYFRQYISLFADISCRENNSKLTDKLSEIKNVIKSDKYKEIVKCIRKISFIKGAILSLNISLVYYWLGKLAWAYNRRARFNRYKKEHKS